MAIYIYTHIHLDTHSCTISEPYVHLSMCIFTLPHTQSVYLSLSHIHHTTLVDSCPPCPSCLLSELIPELSVLYQESSLCLPSHILQTLANHRRSLWLCEDHHAIVRDI